METIPYDWSPDGKWIAATLRRRDGTHLIGLVSVEDGSLRVLKSLDWQQPSKIFFSPDGRSIAYDLQVSETSEEQHVFVMSADGARESAVVMDPSENVIMGWSPDGGHVLFASNRSGSFGLWSVAVGNGRSLGAATLLKSDVASSWSLGLTSSGTMYVWKYASPVFVQASAVDLAAGTLAPGPPAFHRFIGSRGRPEWSPDGKHLVYQSCAPLGGGRCAMWIRSMETGELRELDLKLNYFFFPRWSPDGRELIVRGTDARGRNNGLYRIDARTGKTTLVVSPYPGHTMPQWGADSTHVYYRRDASLIARNLDTGEEREAVRIPTPGAGDIAVSPDGQQLAYVAPDASGTRHLFVLPLAGGAPRSVFTTPPSERITNQLQWTLDGRALVVATMNDAGRGAALWLVDHSANTPRKLNIDITQWKVLDGIRFDRAGTQVAFAAAAGEPGLEIRALENFLPARASAGHDRKK
jgi:Tol biopolymer transport system component